MAESSRGLFQRAIVESGLCMKPMLTLDAAETLGASFAAAMGCEGSPEEALSCLRALTPEAIQTGPARERLPGGVFFQASSEQYGFSPIVDGTLLTEQPEPAFAAGHFARLPVLHGANTAEGALFHAAPLGGLQPEDDAAFMAALTVRFGARAADVAAQYPPADYPSHAEALSAVTSDALFRCPAIRMAEYLRDAGVDNYLYRFDLTVETSFAGLRGRAFHSAEIPYVFGNGYVLGTVANADEPASEAIQGYWARFAHSGDPNGDGAVEWPPFDAAAAHLELAQPIARGADWRSDGCDFWDDVAFAP
jgi:para-nitrobenzyl esterase